MQLALIERLAIPPPPPHNLKKEARDPKKEARDLSSAREDGTREGRGRTGFVDGRTAAAGAVELLR